MLLACLLDLLDVLKVPHDLQCAVLTGLSGLAMHYPGQPVPVSISVLEMGFGSTLDCVTFRYSTSSQAIPFTATC